MQGRCSVVQGLAGTNMRAFLEAADVHYGFRQRYGDEMANHLCQRVGNTDNLELGFAIIVRLLPGSCKGEFDQMLHMAARGDFLERLKNDPQLAFLMATGSDLYDNPELMAEKEAGEWNNGESLDPRSAAASPEASGLVTAARCACPACCACVHATFLVVEPGYSTAVPGFIWLSPCGP